MVNRGGVQRMIKSGYLKRYFKDSELVKIAENHTQTNKQIDIYRDVLRRNVFPEVFYDGTYKTAIQDFISSIERDYPSIIQSVKQKRLGITIRKPVKKKVTKRKGIVKTTQKSSAGTTYSRKIYRGTKYNWGTNQVRLLQINKQRVDMGIISRKEAIKETSRLTGRTIKAVESKYYRIPTEE